MTHTEKSDTKNLNDKSTDKYVIRDGRRYNATTNYLLPMDEGESTRLSCFHIVHNFLFGGDYQAPIKAQLEKGIAVLDSACGSGAHWTMAMGEKYPNSMFTGVDISNVFPLETLPNINFTLGDISKSIPVPDETFDFTFQKLLGLAFTSEEWDSNLKELHRVLKPGGYIELSEIYGVSAQNTGPLMSQIMHAFLTISKAKNIIVKTAPSELPNLLLKAGFKNQTSIICEMPLNHGEHGELYWKCMRYAYETLRPQFAQVYPEWKDISFYNNFLNATEKECSETKCYYQWQVCYAQKLNDTVTEETERLKITHK